MSFVAHKANMKYFCNTLKSIEAPTHTQARLCELLEYLHIHCHHFETSVSSDTPFYDEFFQQIREPHAHQEVCFALLECLIVFCRERQLQTKHNDLPELERNLLDFYEHSHHWHADEESIMQKCYWHDLPNKYKLH